MGRQAGEVLKGEVVTCYKTFLGICLNRRKTITGSVVWGSWQIDGYSNRTLAEHKSTKLHFTKRTPAEHKSTKLHFTNRTLAEHKPTALRYIETSLNTYAFASYCWKSI
jgi:hypothetical protein